MNFFEQIGNNILQILKEKNINQTELAEKIGVSKQVLGKIVKGQKAINAFELRNIAEALNITVDDLLAEKKEVDEKPLLMFMGEIKKNTKKDMEFLTKVISEIISIEEALNE